MKIALLVGIGIVVVVVGYSIVASTVLNPRVLRELETQPDGERARKVMALTLPSGKRIPVNYIQDGSMVYAAADFPWWRELRGEGARVEVLVRGGTRAGHGRAILDDPELRQSVFERLRPSAPGWTGTLVAISVGSVGRD